MSLKILVVDDSRLARMSVAKMLSVSHPDWERLEATNAEEAIGIVKGNPVDIAMVDFNMPGRDGLELAAQLRELVPQMPVAVVSANHQDEVVRRARNAGAAFLIKPLTQKAIDDFLNDAVARLKAQN